MRLPLLLAFAAVPAVATAQSLDGLVPQGSPAAGLVLMLAVGLALRIAPRRRA